MHAVTAVRDVLEESYSNFTTNTQSYTQCCRVNSSNFEYHAQLKAKASTERLLIGKLQEYSISIFFYCGKADFMRLFKIFHDEGNARMSVYSQIYQKYNYVCGFNF